MQKATLADCCIASLETKPHAVHAHPPSTLPRKLNANIAAAAVIAGPQAVDVQGLAQMCGHPVLCCSGRALREPDTDCDEQELQAEATRGFVRRLLLEACQAACCAKQKFTVLAKEHLAPYTCR